MNTDVKSSIAPWLAVADGEEAIRFYKAAFNAAEVYRLEEPEADVVVKLSVNGAEFWVSSDDTQSHEPVAPLGGNNVRMILIEANPDALFQKAIEAGGTEIFPVGEDHGWRLGRLADPFGLHWEIGYQL